LAVSRKASTAISAQELIARDDWPALPSIAVLAGNAKLFKDQILARFINELFGDLPREIRRFQGPASDNKENELPLHVILDELRTPSFLSPCRLVVIERADAFLRIHKDNLLPFVESGFPGGHLVLELAGKLDKRLKIAKKLAAAGWVVNCPQPYDRPPPWDTRTPVWDSELSHWLTRHARSKGLKLDPQTAFTMHDRVGPDLCALDEELEKIKTYLAADNLDVVDDKTVIAVTGDLREDSMFAVVDLFLEGRRGDAVEAVERLFEKGYHADNGSLVVEPASIALPLIGSLLARLRSLRRAHALSATGASADDWVREGLVKKPFLSRFSRQLHATPLPRIRRLLERLYDADRMIKTGAPPRYCVLLLVAE
jgi:DNA polymerase III delta subunit